MPPFAAAAYSRSPSGCTDSARTRPDTRGLFAACPRRIERRAERQPEVSRAGGLAEDDAHSPGPVAGTPGYSHSSRASGEEGGVEVELLALGRGEPPAGARIVAALTFGVRGPLVDAHGSPPVPVSGTTRIQPSRNAAGVSGRRAVCVAARIASVRHVAGVSRQRNAWFLSEHRDLRQPHLALLGEIRLHEDRPGAQGRCEGGEPGADPVAGEGQGLAWQDPGRQVRSARGVHQDRERHRLAEVDVQRVALAVADDIRVRDRLLRRQRVGLAEQAELTAAAAALGRECGDDLVDQPEPAVVVVDEEAEHAVVRAGELADAHGEGDRCQGLLGGDPLGCAGRVGEVEVVLGPKLQTQLRAGDRDRAADQPRDVFAAERRE